MNNKSLLEVAITAVRDTCIVTREVQRELCQGHVLQKPDRSPVTLADYAAQAVIAHRLITAWRDCILVAEESSAMLHAAKQSDLRAELVQYLEPVWHDVREDEVLAAIDVGGQPTAESFWTLDPIDGTKGFLRQGQYAISLAYLHQGRVELGVLGCPNLSADWERPFDNPDPHGLIVYAMRGGGCWAVPAGNGSGQPLPVTCGASQGTTLRVCESQEAAHSDQTLTARIAKLLGGATPLRLDSQAKYVIVARGQADAYLRIPRSGSYEENIWDHAAGMLVATEAGTYVTDINGNALDFTTGKTLARNRGILCASPAWHERILGAINSLALVPDRQ